MDTQIIKYNEATLSNNNVITSYDYYNKVAKNS